ncbi:uncharacterized protein LOC131284806 [Anopheles ziemanni]|uniref:uncharacterized protein LOC131284806 n=1 Tax=Anopheles ziemanni TaxID=345580 RepID=UPI00265E390C|nr:uncharacterized protein LOC131284806 [Anopheles ziemanni]
MMDAPSWRTVEFFSAIIEAEFANQNDGPIHVKGLHIGEANSETAGYMSLIHRVTLEVEVGPSREIKTLSYIVKEKSDQAFGGSLSDLLSVFPKERVFYEHLLPEFERLWLKAGGVRFGPKMFKATDGHETVIVMEDLSRSNFRMRPKRYGLPVEDVKAILSKVAKFHATSVVYLEAGGSFSEHFTRGVYSEGTIDAIEDYYEVLYSAFVKSLEARKLAEEYLNALKQIDGRLLKECCRVLRVNAANFNVLNHGDLWSNNVMFDNDNLLLLDFQTAFYGCFASDILYLLVTTATEILCDELEELLQYYYRQLVNSFTALGYNKPIPSYDELFRQIQKCGVLLLPPLSEAVAIMMTGLTEASDMENITSDHPAGAALRNQVYSNPAYGSTMEAASWRSVEFFRDIIEADLSPQNACPAVVKKIRIGEANSETVGYMSLIHRVTLEVEVGPSREIKTLSYIVKEKSDQAFGATVVDVLSAFPKERELYGHVLPEFERLWLAKGGVQFGPRMFKATDGHETVIVMEDLNQRNFHMRSKRYGLPVKDVKAILSKLAKFHATSVVYLEAGGCFSAHFAEGIFREDTIGVIGRHYEVLYGAFVQSLHERGLPEEYVTPLKQIDGHLLSECCRVLRKDSANFNVLNHDDLWPCNIMFGEDDVLFLDFQTAFYGCFASDILYFLISTATEMLCDGLVELLQYYYRQLVDSFQVLAYGKPIPSYDELFKQVQKHGVLILPTLSEAVAMTMANVVEIVDMEKISTDHPDGEALLKRVYNSPDFVQLVDRLIPTLFHMGLFSNLTDQNEG